MIENCIIKYSFEFFDNVFILKSNKNTESEIGIMWR